MGYSGGAHAALTAPCPAVEDACDGGQQNIAPVEVQRALVEVGEAKEDRGGSKSRPSSHSPFKKILKPSAKEEFFGNGDEEEGEDPRAGKAEDDRTEGVPEGMRVEEAESEAQDQSNREIESKFAQADGQIAQAEAQVEADTLEVSNRNESVDAGVEKQDLVEDGEMGGPGGLEPTEVNRQAEDGKDQELATTGLCGPLRLIGLPK